VRRVRRAGGRAGYSRTVRGADGTLYGSKAERERIGDLRIAEKLGAIEGLQLQVTFALYLDEFGTAFVRCLRLGINAKKKGTRVEAYRADAVYMEGGRLVVEDTKNKLFTRDFRRKAAWMGALGYPVRIFYARGSR